MGGGLARPAKPEPTNVIPLIPRGQGQSVVIGKKCRLLVASSFIDRGGRGLLPTSLPALLSWSAAATRAQSKRRAIDETSRAHERDRERRGRAAYVLRERTVGE